MPDREPRPGKNGAHSEMTKIPNLNYQISNKSQPPKTKSQTITETFDF